VLDALRALVLDALRSRLEAPAGSASRGGANTTKSRWAGGALALDARRWLVMVAGGGAAVVPVWRPGLWRGRLRLGSRRGRGRPSTLPPPTLAPPQSASSSGRRKGGGVAGSGEGGVGVLARRVGGGGGACAEKAAAGHEIGKEWRA
jgi:hypothetical protein